mmetsp:Transcript_8603/g.26135  ORF Transcript_8603/g.26135 Transcript_8603/m.26135 type:complete len:314 (+) Transcript_8603:859-1800(+)
MVFGAQVLRDEPGGRHIGAVWLPDGVGVQGLPALTHHGCHELAHHGGIHAAAQQQADAHVGHQLLMDRGLERLAEHRRVPSGGDKARLVPLRLVPPDQALVLGPVVPRRELLGLVTDSYQGLELARKPRGTVGVGLADVQWLDAGVIPCSHHLFAVLVLQHYGKHAVEGVEEALRPQPPPSGQQHLAVGARGYLCSLRPELLSQRRQHILVIVDLAVLDGRAAATNEGLLAVQGVHDREAPMREAPRLTSRVARAVGAAVLHLLAHLGEQGLLVLDGALGVNYRHEAAPCEWRSCAAPAQAVARLASQPAGQL